MSEARIEVSDLVVRYGGVAAVEGVSFSVGRGGFFVGSFLNPTSPLVIALWKGRIDDA